MAKVKITGHASGTGVLTVTAPNTSSDRTITLPDSTGTLLDENSSLPAANLTGTIADARLPDPLPAIDGSSLTGTFDVKVGYFTKDISDGTASQAITGVGFTPKGVLFVGSQQTTAANFSAIGFGTSSFTQCITQQTSGNWLEAGSRFRLYEDATNARSCYVASLDSDGFTLTWDAKAGTPTGTMKITYCAIG